MSHFNAEMNASGKPSCSFRRPKPHVNYYEHPKPEPVEDLREKLNRKRREEQTNPAKAPPPDPKFNYLSDPSRDFPSSSADTSAGNAEIRFLDDSQANRSPRSRGNFRNRGRGRQKPFQNETQPFNIKVEVKTSTGERTYVVDRDSKLPEFKHVPDHPSQRRGGYRGRGFRRNFRGNVRSGNRKPKSEAFDAPDVRGEALKSNENVEHQLNEGKEKQTEAEIVEQLENLRVQEAGDCESEGSYEDADGVEEIQNKSDLDVSLAETIVIEPSKEKFT